MEHFTGWHYLLIDVANQYGHDKMLFGERIKWVEENLDQLESLADQAETKPLYLKGVQAIRKAQKGLPTGHVVGFDGCASGIQIMSAVTGCAVGGASTGLVGNARADAYGICTEHMNTLLKDQTLSVDIPRKDAKRSLMTTFYCSTAVPKEVFGKETPELNAFYQAAQMTAPGAWELLQDLKDAWKANALSHQWKLPDGFDAKVKVMVKKDARIEVDELDHATFTYSYKENEGTETGRSLPANVVHSLDAYVLRGMHRRCNYNPAMVSTAHAVMVAELDARDTFGAVVIQGCPNERLAYYLDQYERSGIADIVILPYLRTGRDTMNLETKHLRKLVEITEYMLSYKPFEIICIYDEFKCCPNHCNELRQQYINILADLADSNVIGDILGQLHGRKITYKKLSNNLGDLIRNSNYALS